MSESLPGNKKTDQEAGFTILEVMIALSIIGIGLFSVAAMQIGAMRGNATSRSINEGTISTVDRIEMIMSLPWEHTNLSERANDQDGEAGLGDATVATADWSVVDGEYTILWNIAENLLMANTKTIVVIVQWPGPDGIRSVTMRQTIPRIT